MSINQIGMIVAVSLNGVIGKNGAMPWGRYPNDMRHFREVTMGKTVVMGRKTWESIGSRPLPKRENIVLTRDENFHAEGAITLSSRGQVMQIKQDKSIVIIGGGEIYAEFLLWTDWIELTVIKAEFEGDSFFKQFKDLTTTGITDSIREKWELTNVRSFVADNEHPHPYDFLSFRRRPINE